MMSLSVSLIFTTISAMSSRMIFFFVSAVAPGLSHARARSLPNDISRSRSDKVRVWAGVAMIRLSSSSFAGVEITDDDVEQIQIVGDLIRHLQNSKQVRS